MNKVQTRQDELAYEATLGLSNEAAVAAVGARRPLVTAATVSADQAQVE